MTEPAAPAPVTVDAAGAALLRWLITLDPADVARVRFASPGRARPLAQQGPSADYGDEVDTG